MSTQAGSLIESAPDPDQTEATRPEARLALPATDSVAAAPESAHASSPVGSAPSADPTQSERSERGSPPSLAKSRKADQ
eukprot:300275-Prorocentrum_minimum.AAC.1